MYAGRVASLPANSEHPSNRKVIQMPTLDLNFDFGVLFGCPERLFNIAVIEFRDSTREGPYSPQSYYYYVSTYFGDRTAK